MSDINSEAEAVAVLERAGIWPYQPRDAEIFSGGERADFMLAYLVRQGVPVRESHDKKRFDAGRKGDRYWMYWGPTPLVAATRAFLANREEQG